MARILLLCACYVQFRCATAVLSSVSPVGGHHNKHGGGGGAGEEVLEVTDAAGQGAFFHRPHSTKTQITVGQGHFGRGLLGVKERLARGLDDAAEVRVSSKNRHHSHGGGQLEPEVQGYGATLVQLSDYSVQDVAAQKTGSQSTHAAASAWMGQDGTCELVRAVAEEGQSWNNAKLSLRLRLSCVPGAAWLQVAEGTVDLAELGFGAFQTWRRNNVSFFALRLSAPRALSIAGDAVLGVDIPPGPNLGSEHVHGDLKRAQRGSASNDRADAAKLSGFFPQGSHDFLLRGRYDERGLPVGEIGLVAGSNTHAISFRPAP